MTWVGESQNGLIERWSQGGREGGREEREGGSARGTEDEGERKTCVKISA